MSLNVSPLQNFTSQLINKFYKKIEEYPENPQAEVGIHHLLIRDGLIQGNSDYLVGVRIEVISAIFRKIISENKMELILEVIRNKNVWDLLGLSYTSDNNIVYLSPEFVVTFSKASKIALMEREREEKQSKIIPKRRLKKAQQVTLPEELAKAQQVTLSERLAKFQQVTLSGGLTKIQQLRARKAIFLSVIKDCLAEESGEKLKAICRGYAIFVSEVLEDDKCRNELVKSKKDAIEILVSIMRK